MSRCGRAHFATCATLEVGRALQQIAAARDVALPEAAS